MVFYALSAKVHIMLANAQKICSFFYGNRNYPNITNRIPYIILTNPGKNMSVTRAYFMVTMLKNALKNMRIVIGIVCEFKNQPNKIMVRLNSHEKLP